MPVPPSGLPTGLTTSQINNNIFFPNYHAWWGRKELNQQVWFNLFFLSSATAQPTATTTVTMSSLNIPDGTDYVLIQPQSAPISISYAAGTIGGLIVPTQTIFNLPLDKANLSNLVISSGVSQNVSVYFFSIQV